MHSNKNSDHNLGGNDSSLWSAERFGAQELGKKPYKSSAASAIEVGWDYSSIAEDGKPVRQSKIWSPMEAIGISLLAYVFSQVILIVPIAVIKFIQSATGSDLLNVNSTLVNIVFSIFSALAILMVLWLFLRSRGAGFSALGFKKSQPSDLKWLIVAIFLYILSLIIGMALASLIPGFNANQKQEIGYQDGSLVNLVGAFFGLVVLPPLAEEMLFRGFLYRGLASRFPKLLAAIVTSLLFAIVHFQWNVGVDVFILSMVLIFLYERTKNLWMCVLLHSLKNGIAFVVLFLIK